jgi:phosphatidylglycerophosphatase A
MPRKIEIVIGTGFFTGYSKIAPATCCSVIALVLYWFIPQNYWIHLAIILFAFFYGIYVSGRLEDLWKEKDPKRVTIDEFCGMFLSLFLLEKTLKIVILAFILFRLFDILKPFPAERVQSIKGGLGIMIDDVIAAVYTNIAVRIIDIATHHFLSL